MAIDLMEQESLMILELEKHVSTLPSLHGIRNSPEKGQAGLWGLAGIWRGGRGASARITSGPGRDWLPHVLMSEALSSR